MALRPLHILLTLALFMAFFEVMSSIEEDEFYSVEDDELEAIDELEPRSPHHKKHAKHGRRRVYYRRRTRKPRFRIRRPGTVPENFFVEFCRTLERLNCLVKRVTQRWQDC